MTSDTCKNVYILLDSKCIQLYMYIAVHVFEKHYNDDTNKVDTHTTISDCLLFLPVEEKRKLL